MEAALAHRRNSPLACAAAALVPAPPRADHCLDFSDTHGYLFFDIYIRPADLLDFCQLHRVEHHLPSEMGGHAQYPQDLLEL
jgi:hypothetical protein